jgi:hypothetical protein
MLPHDRGGALQVDAGEVISFRTAKPTCSAVPLTCRRS